MSAVLTENGFIDTVADANKLKTDAYVNRIALGHANGIVKALGLKKKSRDSSGTYTVKAGDTLWSIAQAHNVTVQQLKNVNGQTDDIIQPGQVLIITGLAHHNSSKD